MSDQLRELIAKIAHAHTHSDETFRYCYCGKDLESESGEWFDVWSDHLADVLIEQLGLQAESAHKLTVKATGRSVILTDPHDVRAAERMEAGGFDHNTLAPVTRYVTAWASVE